MTLLPLLASLWLASPPDAGAAVACQTVADCWLNEDGAAIHRPANRRGRALPRGDCGKNLLWLRNVLTCEERVCTVKHVGDRC